YFRRNPAHYGAGNDRIIGDRDGEEMGLEDFRHRDGIINGRVVRAQPQIEDNILDHDAILRTPVLRPNPTRPSSADIADGQTSLVPVSFHVMAYSRQSTFCSRLDRTA